MNFTKAIQIFFMFLKQFRNVKFNQEFLNQYGMD